MSNLFQEFESVTKQDWLNKIEVDAKGKLVAEFDWKINSALTISPFAHRDDLHHGKESISRGEENNAWSIGQQILAKDIKQSNKQIITALENGVSTLFVVFDNTLSQDDFLKLFHDVNFTYITTYFVVQDEVIIEDLLNSIIEFCQKHDQKLQEVKGGLIYSPIVRVDCNSLSSKFGSILSEFSFASASMDNLFSYKETVVHEVSSVALDLIRILESNQEGNRITLNINVGKSYLLNIAKIRAIHLLINNILKAYNSNPSILINAMLSHSSLSENENQNLIQFTSQAMSAVIGGVDCLQLPASDINSNNGSSDFRKQLSRNIQSIMQMESFMSKVADPAAGSYYIEQLTDKIAEQSWAYIQNNG